MKTGFVFDLDGTLVDSIPGGKVIRNHIADEISAFGRLQ